MLMRTDPFRALDRLSRQLFNGAQRPATMPMDAWREGGSVLSLRIQVTEQAKPRKIEISTGSNRTELRSQSSGSRSAYRTRRHS
ncbi:hypothetical protein [Streptomyces sp. SAJ15]|uniref:hypothetical protein n=1 Tax=Streptomyces sp. SAJ15 TaxID=2011095 RepID=UPI0011862E77|nr:hypothetical protein [Streptomyces sp. SAJ15]TVL91280.1 hypothetical protein CD790_18765 [Streptomyces sp. SAJ15]